MNSLFLFCFRVSASVSAAVQKLCLILGFLKDLLTTLRLSDSCILQLVKTCFTTFLVDNMQLLQLKSIGVICTVDFLFLPSLLVHIDSEFFFSLTFNSLFRFSHHTHNTRAI
jgi:hypothetical protein